MEMLERNLRDRCDTGCYVIGRGKNLCRLGPGQQASVVAERYSAKPAGTLSRPHLSLPQSHIWHALCSPQVEGTCPSLDCAKIHGGACKRGKFVSFSWPHSRSSYRLSIYTGRPESQRRDINLFRGSTRG